ncbi:DUF1365 domain-containing protein [Ferruginivarius sediminum]|uniref:DUF1365 domain-containing protein n=1 Tax=Ferruginivarius sediminum TaxID=2661937 RepID=A0A369T7V7_9PROT|nr:DUF1365 domain-containing protein [Ferruginivarius sediminum]RDD61390.1 DUF1365 domain-containing protein [Ferruginivarius sediminum]
MQSALYIGNVMHRRLQPFRHRFSYGVVSLFIDLDELAELDKRLRLFSVNRANVFSFHERDHGPRDGSSLRTWIDARLVEAGIDLQGGAVRLLCFPRMWGYVFNPLTMWFCHHRDGGLRAVLYEVRNTFGEQHCYLLPVEAGHDHNTPIRQSCDKAFYVSPFITMEARYRFRLLPPGERLSVSIREETAAGETLVATQTGRRRALSDRSLLRALATHPAMTFKVIAAIHWQALHLWRKGARFHRRPAPPAETVTHSKCP